MPGVESISDVEILPLPLNRGSNNSCPEDGNDIEQPKTLSAAAVKNSHTSITITGGSSFHESLASIMETTMDGVDKINVDDDDDDSDEYAEFAEEKVHIDESYHGSTCSLSRSNKTSPVGGSFHGSVASLSKSNKSGSIRVPIDLSVLELVNDHHEELNKSMNFTSNNNPYSPRYSVDATHKTRGSSASFAMEIDPTLLEMVKECRRSDQLYLNKDGSYRKKKPREEEALEERQSSLFCFCCCDMIKACVIFNLINIASMIFLMTVSILEPASLNRIDIYVDEDDDSHYYRYNADYVSKTISGQGIYALARMSVSMVFGILGIVGALKFQKYLVLATGLWYCPTYIVMSLLVQRWDGAVLAAIYSYPNFHLFWQFHKKKITKDNYSETEQHCCCGEYCGGERSDE